MSYFNLTRAIDPVLCQKQSAKYQGGHHDQKKHPALKGPKRVKKQQTIIYDIKSEISSELQDN